MGSISVLIGILIIQLVVSIFGSHFGIGGISAPVSDATVSTEAPGILGALGWVWESLDFWWKMNSFQVEDMPVFISAVFLLMTVTGVVLIIRLVRGVA